MSITEDYEGERLKKTNRLFNVNQWEYRWTALRVCLAIDGGLELLGSANN